MGLIKQACSFEYAKQLKELGVTQDSLFCWTTNLDLEFLPTDIRNNAICIAAFTAAELGEILPNRITVPDAEPFDNFVITINKFYSVNEDRSLTNNYTLNYSCDSTSATGIDAWMTRKLTKNIFDPNLANAMARMLIFLIENKLI